MKIRNSAVLVAASLAVGLTACSGNGATGEPSQRPSSAAVSAAPSAPASSAAPSSAPPASSEPHGLPTAPIETAVPSEDSLPEPPLYAPSTDATWRVINYSGCDITVRKLDDYRGEPDLERYVQIVSKWFDYETWTFFEIVIDNTQGAEACSVGNVQLIGEDQDVHDADSLSFWLEEGDAEKIPADEDYPGFVDLVEELEEKLDRPAGTKGTSWTLFHSEVKPFVALYVNDGTPLGNMG